MTDIVPAELRLGPLVSGKTVAIVGRAASLLGSGNGRAIDACDVVVRVNWLLPITEHAANVGLRTDVVYYAYGVRFENVPADVMLVRVDRALRRRLAKKSRLSHKVYRPTTGVVAVQEALRGGATCVRAFGFDFYRSGYAAPAPERRNDKQTKWAHDPAEDRRLFARMMRKAKGRLQPDPILQRALAA